MGIFPKFFYGSQRFLENKICHAMICNLRPNYIRKIFSLGVTPTFYKNKNFVQIGVHIKMHIKLQYL
jgi:hypothetical protein